MPGCARVWNRHVVHSTCTSSAPAWEMHSSHSLVPRPPPFFVLRFVFSIIHGSGRACSIIHGSRRAHALPLPCIILNANRRTKKQGRPGNEATVHKSWKCLYRWSVQEVSKSCKKCFVSKYVQECMCYIITVSKKCPSCALSKLGPNLMHAQMGKRILKLPKWASNSVVNVMMGWPTMKARILVRKLGFLLRLVSADGHALCARTFQSISDDMESVCRVRNVENLRKSFRHTTLTKCLGVEMM